MSQKTIIMAGLTIGSLIGGYAPTFFGVSGFSFTSLLTSTIGALLGIFVAYKLTES